MRIKSRLLSIVFKLVTTLAGFWGLELSLRLFSGLPQWSMLNYFTCLSNLVAAVYFLLAALRLIIKPNCSPTFCPVWKGIITMGLSVTMLVAHFMLGGFTMGGSMSLSLLLLHYIVPVLTLLDWLLFDEKGHMKLYSPFAWAMFPILYLIYAFIAAGIGDGIGYGGSRFPYPFLDVDMFGVPRVAVTILCLLVFFEALGYIYVAIDRVLARRASSRKR